MSLTFITGNEHKFNEVRLIIPSIERISVDLIEIQELDPQKIIEHKLHEAAMKMEGNFIVDDVSLKINALNGFPGPLIKWLEKSIKAQGIYDLVKDKSDKSATAICSIGARINNEFYFFEGIAEGQLVPPQGNSGFGFDPIFIPNGADKTYAEMAPEEIVLFKHRAKALRKLEKLI